CKPAGSVMALTQVECVGLAEFFGATFGQLLQATEPDGRRDGATFVLLFVGVALSVTIAAPGELRRFKFPQRTFPKFLQGSIFSHPGTHARLKLAIKRVEP